MNPGETFDSHAPVSTDLTKQTCRDFMRGVCHRGLKCRFHHPVLSTMSFLPRSIPICRDFQNGQCSRRICKYAHVDRSSQQTLTNKQLSVTNMHSILNENEPANSQPNYGNDTYYLHSPSPTYTGISGAALECHPNFHFPINYSSYAVDSPSVSSNYDDRSPSQVYSDEALRKLHQENFYLRQQNNFLMNKLYQYEIISQSRENSLLHSPSMSFPFPEASINTSDDVSYETANIFDSAFAYNKDSMSLFPFPKMLHPSSHNFVSSVSSNLSSSGDVEDLSSFTTPDNIHTGTRDESAFRQSFENTTKIGRNSKDPKLMNDTRYSSLGTSKSPKQLSGEKSNCSMRKTQAELNLERLDDDISQIINPTINEFLNISNLR